LAPVAQARGGLGSLDVLWSTSERYGVLVVVQEVHDPNGVFANSSDLVITLPDDGVIIEEDVLVYWLDAADVHVNRRFWSGADVVLDLDQATLDAAPTADDFRQWGFEEWDVEELVRIEAEARRRLDRKE
jgi:hypothetical protein